jgi:prepilin-type N-terminal cleavage/methylation domain-containing protein
MTVSLRRSKGFTLIELMVAIGILLIFAILALPSFQEVRQRAALRSAAEQVQSFWNQARLEAAKRNAMVKVGITQTSAGATFCLGAATTTSSTDTTPCDCTITDNSTGRCDVARYPSAGDNTRDWNGVTLSAVTIAGSTWTPSSGVLKPVIIEPKRTALITTGGLITLQGPSGKKTYKLSLNVDTFGRGVLCEPSSMADKMSDYASRRC